MKIYAIIPARSGSVGLKNKNIRLIDGEPLLSYSIKFANALGIDRVFCSTDSEEYAAIAKKFGAEVPFLRSDFAASSTAMEQDILVDMYQKFKEHNISQPDILVWLRPTFVFRSINDVKKCIDQLIKDPTLTASRTVCESEGRLYKVENDILIPSFDDFGKSMMRRQDFGDRYKVFSTDVFRAAKMNTNDDFLGRKVGAVITNKLCGMDIDDEFDFHLVENILKYNKSILDEYIDTSYF